MDLTSCLFQWLKTFELRGNCAEPKDLCDGVAITYALVNIAPEHFSPSLLSKIESDCGNSWFLRVSNLRRIYLCVVDFYSEVLDRSIPEKLQPDLDAIARDLDVRQLGHMLQLILGCAINCVNKEKHIEVMTTLSLEVKHGLKMAIDELENFEDSLHSTAASSADASKLATEQASQSQSQGDTNASSASRVHSSEEFGKLQEDLAAAHQSRERASQRCVELENMISKLKDEKKSLKIENEKLSDKLFRSTKGSSVTESTLRFDSIEHENLFQRLNNQINAQQSELTRMEEQKEDYRINLEIKEKEYRKTLLQVEQLQSRLNDFKHDRDELDRLKYLNEEIVRYKYVNEVQRKKLEEFQELRKQMKLLEDRNASLIKQTCELEEEKKSMSVFKGQLELIKKQRDDLRSKANEESFRADKAEDELRRLHAKHSEMTQDNEKMQIEMSNMKSEIAAKRADHSFTRGHHTIDLDLSSGDGRGADKSLRQAAMTIDDGRAASAERLIRLEFENEKLKKELQQSNDEKVRLLESQLEDDRSRVAKLEATNRANGQRIIELEAQIAEAKSSSTTCISGSPGSGSIDDQATRNRLAGKVRELEQEKANLLAVISKKNDELHEKEERFRKHVSKAKETLQQVEQLQAVTHITGTSTAGTGTGTNVPRTPLGGCKSCSLPTSSSSLPLETSKQRITATATSSENDCYWRQIAAARELEIEQLKNDFEKSSAFRDMEERLMTINYHNMSFRLQRKSAEDRIYSNNFTPSTFLARQRQASSRKFIIPPSDLVE